MNMKTQRNFYTFFGSDWRELEPAECTARKRHHHVQFLRTFTNDNEAIQHAKALIKRWRCESVRIIDGARDINIVVKDDLENTEYNFTTEVNGNDRAKIERAK